MKAKTIITTVTMCLLFALLGVSATPPAATVPTVSVTDAPTVELRDIRTFELCDLPRDSAYYDAACYMLYYELMGKNRPEFADSNGDIFRPFDIATYADAATALNVNLKQNEIQEAENSPLTRACLAAMLYDAAKKQGYPTETTLVTLPFPDADAVSEEDENALLWVIEKGLFASFTGLRLLPNTAVSRLQLAEAVVSLKALDPKDTVAAEITSALPIRECSSLAIGNHNNIQSVIDAAAEKYGAVGVQVAVIEKGVVTDTFEYGWATENKDKMTADHKLRSASITKVAIGVAAQLLREEGKINLDADISEYWGFKVQNPHFPNDPITIRNILTHTSSITNASLSTPRDYDYLKSKLQSDGFSPNRPGNISKWSYNNHAFGVLGVTLELAAQETLNEFLAKKLFAPMDMDASFTPGDIKNTDLLATIYKDEGAVGLGTQKAKTMKSHTTPGATGTAYSGGLTASAYDLAKFFALLAGDGIYEGVRLIDAESVELIESRTENTVRGGFYQALPLRYTSSLYGREGIYFHTGSSYGAYNCASYDPATGDGVIVLTSGANGSKGKFAIYKICEEINQYIYDVIG